MMDFVVRLTRSSFVAAMPALILENSKNKYVFAFLGPLGKLTFFKFIDCDMHILVECMLALRFF